MIILGSVRRSAPLGEFVGRCIKFAKTRTHIDVGEFWRARGIEIGPTMTVVAEIGRSNDCSVASCRIERPSVWTECEAIGLPPVAQLRARMVWINRVIVVFRLCVGGGRIV